MKVVIASDHNGVNAKRKLINYLKKIGHEVIDFGTHEEENVDYPVLTFSVGTAIVAKDYELGILICGTGIGMSIACNKVKGIRCAKVSSIEEARLSKQHNNANVIAISGRMPVWKTKKIIKNFIVTPFSNEERHIRRNGLIDQYHD